MEEKKALAVIEAILFTMGDSVEIDRLAVALETDKKTVRDYLSTLQSVYEKEDRGITLTFFEDAVQLATKGEYYNYLIKLVKAPRKMTLSDSVIETLSIVAYKQPVTKGDIEKIRGVGSDFAIGKLLEYELIEEVGRLDAPGRPILFGTTEQFLRSFGISSAAELPEISPLQMEEFREEAEVEVIRQTREADGEDEEEIVVPF